MTSSSPKLVKRISKLNIVIDEYQLQTRYSAHGNAFHTNKVLKGVDSSPSYQSLSPRSSFIARFLTPRESHAEETDGITTPRYKQEKKYKLLGLESIKTSGRNSPTNELRSTGITFRSKIDIKEESISPTSRRSSISNLTVQGKIIESLSGQPKLMKAPPTPSKGGSDKQPKFFRINDQRQAFTPILSTRKKILTSSSSVILLQKQKQHQEQESKRKQQIIASIALSPRQSQISYAMPNSARLPTRQLTSFDGFERMGGGDVTTTSSATLKTNTSMKVMLIPSAIISLTEPNEEESTFIKRRDVKKESLILDQSEKKYSNLISRPKTAKNKVVLKNLNFLDFQTPKLKNYCSLSRTRRGEQVPSRCFEERGL